MTRTVVFTLAVLVGYAVPAAPAQQDLRAQFGTESLDAAKAVLRGIQAAQAGKKKDAVTAFDEALKLDPKCGMAYFQKAIAQVDLGDVEEGIASYKKVLADGTSAGGNIRATAATNIGLVYGRLGEFDNSNLWLSRGILEDYDNQFKQRGKAYRNLAINLREQHRQLSAAMAVALAYEDKAPNCDMAMVREFFRTLDNSEAAKLLHFDDGPSEVKPRAEAAVLEEARLEGTIAETVRDLLPDPRGRFVVATVAAAPHYYLLRTGATVDVRKVEGMPIVGACLVDGSLYLSRSDPNRIDQVEVETGKTVKSYPLPKPAPATFAAFPAQNRVFFPNDGIVQQYDLATGRVRETNTPGQVVRGHPNQKFVFSYTKPERGSRNGYVVLDGRVYFVDRGFDWSQTTLFKSVLTPTGLLLAEVRDNAASNGGRLVVGQDGGWVGVAGGGGFRPLDKTQKGGYGIAVFDARNLEKLQGFFPTDAYPQGFCLNPVTGTVVAIRAPDFHVAHLASPGAGKAYPGKWTGVSTWTGDGRLLVMGKEGGGVALYRTELTKDEEKYAAAWPETIKVTPLVGSARPAVVKTEAIASLSQFAVPAAVTPDAVRAVLDQSIKNGRTTRLAHWAAHPAYQTEAAVAEAAAAIKALTGGASADLGVALYKVRQAAQKYPGHAPLQFFLAEIQSRKDQKDLAAEGFLKVVRADAGQTDVTLLALEGLSHHHADKGDDLKAAYCWAAALEVDKVRQRTITKLGEALRKAKMTAEADTVSRLQSAGEGAVGSPAPAAAVRGLPPLPIPGNLPKLDGEALYAKAAPSVVLIKTRDGTGSGVCVGRGDVVVTNAHVVGEAEEVEVQSFALKDKTLARRAVARGRVVYRSEAHDLAVVLLPPDVPRLVPLPITAGSPKAGAKVFALGNPGLGRTVLEQSISEGIVSSPGRVLDGQPYVQHTSAVNPGNSGGPLLDESGRVVGIVTLKSQLQNVNFAIPVETVRKAFPEAKKAPGP